VSLVAYAVVWEGIPHTTVYVAASTRSEAISLVFTSCREAYDSALFTEFRATRAHKYDELAGKISPEEKSYELRLLGWISTDDDRNITNSMGCAGGPADDSHIRHPQHQYINDWLKENRIAALKKELDIVQEIK
jgi:hypothetical protein